MVLDQQTVQCAFDILANTMVRDLNFISPMVDLLGLVQATERKNLRTELVSKLEKQGISTDGAIIDYDGTDPLPLDVLVDSKLGTVSIVASQNPNNSSALFGTHYIKNSLIKLRRHM
jgi:hypothetical protein